jgi:hypothetical protein
MSDKNKNINGAENHFKNGSNQKSIRVEIFKIKSSWN